MLFRRFIRPISVPAAIVLTIFAAVKLAILLRYGALSAPDTGGYQDVANAMLHDPRFWISIPDWKSDALPMYAFRPIGYPLLLMLVQSWTVIVLIQIVLSLTVAWLMCRLVLEATASPALAAAAAAFYLLGQSILWDASVLSDTLYCALFNTVMFKLLRAGYLRYSLSASVCGLLGLAWGYSIWVRENGLYLTILPIFLLLLLPTLSVRERLSRLGVFLLPIALMVAAYAGWNHVPTGETFVGITGTANYLRPVFEIARAGRVDPFADGSVLSQTVKANATDFSYPEQVEILGRFQRQTGLDALEIQRIAQQKLVDTIRRWPLDYAMATVRNLDPIRLGPMMFDPLSALNDFYQLGIPPYQRIIPGTGAKSFKSLAALHQYGWLVVAVTSLILQVLSAILFLYALGWTLVKGARAIAARRWPVPEPALALRAMGIFMLLAVSFAMIHSEARHLMPAEPAFLLATAIAVGRRPASALG